MFQTDVRAPCVPLSLSPSYVTRKKTARKKRPREILGARSARKEGLPPKIIVALTTQKYDWLMLRALTTCFPHSRYVWRLAGMFWNWSKSKWHQSKSKRWNRASQAVMFFRICQRALERFKFIQCFAWQSFSPQNPTASVLVISLLNSIVQVSMGRRL